MSFMKKKSGADFPITLSVIEYKAHLTCELITSS